MTITTQFPAATELDRLCVDTIRMLSIDAVQKAPASRSPPARVGDPLCASSARAAGPRRSVGSGTTLWL
jgi:hypothetical protein